MKMKKLLSLMLAVAMFVTTALSSMISSEATILDIETINAELVLEGYTEEQLRNFPLRTVFDKSICTADDGTTHTIGESYDSSQNKNIIWTRYAEKSGMLVDDIQFDNYQSIDINSSVYMWKEIISFKESDRFDFYVDVIIGSGKQLDPNNVRYRIHTTVILPNEEMILNGDAVQIWQQDENGICTKAKINVQKNFMIPLESVINPDGSQSDLRSNIMRVSILDRNSEDIYLAIDKELLYGEKSEISIKIFSFSNIDNTCSPENDVTNMLLSDNKLKLSDEDVTHYFHGVESLVFCYYLNDEFVRSELWTIDIVDIYLNGGLEIVDINGNVAGDYNYDADSIVTKDERSATYTLYDGFSKNNIYYLKQTDLGNTGLYFPESTNIIKIVEGSHYSVEDIHLLPDIKESLLNGSYLTSFDEGEKNFTIYYECPYNDTTDGITKTFRSIYRFKIIVEEGTEEAPNEELEDIDTGLYVKSIRTDEINNVNEFVVENSDKMPMDSYSGYMGYGYQTIFVSDDIDMSKIYLAVDADQKSNIYNAKNSQKVDFSQTQDFSSGMIQYTISSGIYTRNHFVSIIKKQKGGAKLYVNSPLERHIYSFDEYHNIIIANIGDEKLTGLKVEWSKAPKNIKLHDYWTVGGENNDTLAPMTDASKTDYLAKIKLIPIDESEGEVSGQLKISADGQESIYVDISGSWGAPKFITESPLPQGVKFVPYSAIIATNTYFAWDTKYVLTGILPSGISFNEKTGEIYGVPNETGIFEFSITVESPYREEQNGLKKDFVLEILDNTNDNVYEASDENYDIKTHLGEEVTEGAHDYNIKKVESFHEFSSTGEFGEFIALWLNGVKLTEGADYTCKEGSTIITISGQTLRGLEEGETNTIAAEFRVDGEIDNELKRTAQNFTIGALIEGGGEENEDGSSLPVIPPIIRPVIPEINDNDTTSDTSNDGGKVKNVIDLINKISDDVTTDDADMVEAARKAYDTLTAEQKKLVTNYDDLIDAEEKLEELKDEDVEADADEEDNAEDVEFTTTTFIGRVININGERLSNLNIEIHSEVQTTTTDASGVFKFDELKFGSHTLTITDSDGNSASKKFELTEGSKFSVSSNEIVAEAGGIFELNIRFDGTKIEFLDDTANNIQGESVHSANEENPKTGTALPLILVSAVTSLAVALHFGKKKGSE